MKPLERAHISLLMQLCSRFFPEKKPTSFLATEAQTQRRQQHPANNLVTREQNHSISKLELFSEEND